MTLRTKFGMLLTIACLAAMPGLGRASTALPSVKGIGVAGWTSNGRCPGNVGSVLLAGVGGALINRAAFGPQFSATLAYQQCPEPGSTGSANISLRWFSKLGQLVCNGAGSFTVSPTATVGLATIKYAGPVSCQQLPHGITYKGRIAMTVGPSVTTLVGGLGAPTAIFILS